MWWFFLPRCSASIIQFKLWAHLFSYLELGVQPGRIFRQQAIYFLSLCLSGVSLQPRASLVDTLLFRHLIQDLSLMEPSCTSVGWHPSSCNLWLSRFLFFYWCFSIELLASWLAWMLVFCLFIVLTCVMYSINSTFSVPVLLPNDLVHLGNIQMQYSFSCFSISKVGLESTAGIGTRCYTLLHHMHKSLTLWYSWPSGPDLSLC